MFRNIQKFKKNSKRLKTFYSQEADKWMINHPGQRITEFQVSRLFWGAYECAATMLNSVSGFRSTGIVPYDPDVFKEDFAPAMVTEIAMEAHDTDETTSPSQRVIALADDEQSSFSDDTTSTRTSTEVNHSRVHKSNELLMFCNKLSKINQLVTNLKIYRHFLRQN